MKHLIKIALFLTTLTLIACGGSSGGGDPETPAGGGTPPAPTKTDLSIADAQGSEGGNITFTVTSTPNIAKAISFDYKVNFTGAANASDLTGDTSGKITIATNDSNATILIAIFDDNFKEPAETFQIMLSNLSTSSADFTQNTAIGTIAESDPNGEIPITITDQSAAEGSSLNFKVTAGVTTTELISFTYTVDFAGQTAIASDLGSGQQLTGRETIATGDSSTTISIGIAEDTQTEPDETFRITLSRLTPSNATFDFDNRGIAIGKILASDPQIRISDATASSENNISFRVTTNQAISKPITFSYNLVFDNPIALSSASTSDFSSGSTSGNETIAVDSTTTTIEIDLVNDEFKEQNETFQIQLSNLTPTEAKFTDSTATGTISQSDSTGVKTRIGIANAQGREGENITFTVTATPPIAEPITFTFEATLDNKTTASPSDLSGNLTGQRTIATNDSSTTISIAIKDDLLREADETFLVILNKLITPTDATFGDPKGEGKILANDKNGIVVISVADAEASENSGTINFKVTSAFSAVAGSPFTFDYESTVDSPFQSNSSASANDFDATTRMATISVDASSTTISISLMSDTIAEPDETFRLLLTNLSNATLDSNSAEGTILNDDVSNVRDATAMIGDGQITLNWTKPSESVFAGVVIAQATSDTAPLSCETATNVKIIDDQQTPSNITGLTNGSTYSFRICARSNTDSLSNGVELANLTLTVVDRDKDGLIELTTATEFNNIRYNLRGTSYRTRPSVGNSSGCPNNVCRGYELTANIDLSSFTNWNPIGSSSDRFTAFLEGNDKTISNLTIDRTSDSYIGLFAAIQDASIGNLKLATVDIAGGGNVGALVGNATGTNTLSNIELIGDESQTEITAGGDVVGGLAGWFSGGTISDASSSMDIIGGNDVIGGLVGLLAAGGSIKNSSSTGNLTNGIRRVGGLVGWNGGNISQSSATGMISSFSFAGGLVGWNAGNISQSWASGSVRVSLNRVGGLVGHNESNISQSWASGNATSVRGVNVGGLVGQVGGEANITQTWASGNVSSSIVGGLVGIFFNTGINGRNYQLNPNSGNIAPVAGGGNLDLANGDGVGVSFILGGLSSPGRDATSLRALAALSGAASEGTSDYGTKSSWHAGFDSANPVSGTNIDLKTKYCDTNGNGMIDDGTVAGNPNERTANNSVWVMGPTANDNVTTNTNEAGVTATYYQIPAIRCIANTKGITDQTKIDEMRKIEIDRQRHKFPQP